jgi:hypothetical protein
VARPTDVRARDAVLRSGKPEALNSLSLLLVSGAGSWMVDACVPVNGGPLLFLAVKSESISEVASISFEGIL